MPPQKPTRPPASRSRSAPPARAPSPGGRVALAAALLIAIIALAWFLLSGGGGDAATGASVARSSGASATRGASGASGSSSASGRSTSGASSSSSASALASAASSTAGAGHASASSSTRPLSPSGPEPFAGDPDAIRGGASRGDGRPLAGTITPPDASPTAETATGPRYCEASQLFPDIAERVPPPSSLEWATVAKVIDGDTIHTTEGDKVRLIGINTPEKGEPVCKEATDFLGLLVKGKKVGLQVDVEPLDQFKRRLAYVFVDGRFVNGEMVRRGYAHHYRWEPNVKYAKPLLELQRAARKDGFGMWSLPLPAPASSYVTDVTGHIFHRFDCAQARRLDAKKRVELPSRDEAYDTGRKACPACRP